MNESNVSSSSKSSSLFPASLGSRGWANQFLRESATQAVQAVALSSTFLVGDGFDTMAANDPFVTSTSNENNNKKTNTTILDQLNDKDEQENIIGNNIIVSGMLAQTIPDCNTTFRNSEYNNNDDSDIEEDDPIMSLVKQTKRTRKVKETNRQMGHERSGSRNTDDTLLKPLTNRADIDDDDDNKSWSTATSTESVINSNNSKAGVSNTKKYSNRFMNDLDNRISRPSKPIPESFTALTSVYPSQKTQSDTNSNNINGIELSNVFSSLKKFSSQHSNYSRTNQPSSTAPPPPLARPKRSKQNQTQEQQHQLIDNDNVVKISSSELMLSADEEKAMLLLSSNASSGSYNNNPTVTDVFQTLYQVLFNDQSTTTTKPQQFTTMTTSNKKRRQSMILVTSFIVAIGIIILYKVISTVEFSTTSISAGETVQKESIIINSTDGGG
jgi:hypothetical protein